MLSFEESLNRMLAAAQPVVERRHLPLAAALGRILAEDQYAQVNSPPDDNSAMDGYALRVSDLAAGEGLPVRMRIAAGQVAVKLPAGEAVRIFTGAPLPNGADAVVMQEHCQVLEEANDGKRILVLGEVNAGQNIRRTGADIKVGECILSAGTPLRAQELGLAASAGLAHLPVFRRLRVAVFFTGDELIEPGQQLPAGAIYNSNRSMLNALLQGMDCEVLDMGNIPDQLMATRAALREAAIGNDLIITSGGVSVGGEDHVRPAVEAEGEIALWKIAIKPGKPLAVGSVRREQAKGNAKFVGLPGNPVSAYATFAVLVRPIIRKMQGGLVDAAACATPTLRLPVSCSLPAGERSELLRVRLNANGKLEPYVTQDSSVLTSLVWADGLALKPARQSVSAGQLLGYWPFEMLLS